MLRTFCRSVGSFAALHSIDQVLATKSPYDDQVSDAWRTRLGDWRELVTLPANTTTDSGIRLNFYAERGVDPKLTGFPRATFIETLKATGLRNERPTLVEIYGAPLPPADCDEDEESFNRTNMAHDWLQRFETQLRRFIDDLMTKEFGPEWPKHNLPNNLYEDWQDKKAKAERAGASARPLIAYADFTHYELVICNRKNWNVFANFFGRTESIRNHCSAYICRE